MKGVVSRSIPAVLLFTALSLTAQSPSAPAGDPGTQGSTGTQGKVLYQRSDTSPAIPDAENLEARANGGDNTLTGTITDADRVAVTFTRYALDVRLQPSQHAIAVRAQITLRNDGDHALQQLPLQLSSTLHWEQLRLAGSQLQRLRFRESAVASDVDHTGELSEAAVVLPHPLAPGQSLSLDVLYSGMIVKSAARLTAIGTPSDVAERSDWDEVSSEFVGLRGFGNTVWYPASSVPVRLGDGDKLFAEVGRVKQKQASAIISMQITDEAAGMVPTVGILNGTVVPLTVAPGTEQANVPSLLSCALPAAPLGFQTLSLFLANRQRTTTDLLDVYAKPEETASAQAYVSAALQVAPLLRTWLGEKRKHSLSILDLPGIDDAPFEERQTLYTGLQPVAADHLTDLLSHSLAHAYFVSPRPWLNEGVAHFMASLWTEQTKTREVALNQLDAQRSALALAEPGEAGTHPDTSLLLASDAIFYRTKAAYVLWMLRQMIGDNALQAVLKAYDPAADTTDNYFEQLVSRFAKDPAYAANNATSGPGDLTEGKAAGTMGANKDLHWFFEDWVYHDRGLPDLSITSVVPSKASTPNTYIVAVNVANTGGAGAEVPITLTSGTTQVTERIVIPAHGTAVRRMLIQDEPVQVQLNDGVVPEVAASEHQQRIHYAQAVTP